MKRVCQYCGKELKGKRGRAETCHECSELYKKLLCKNNSEIRREKSKHSCSEIEEIKNKYKEGIPKGEIENWINNLIL